MPTENRSSNTEQMVSVPQALATRITGESYQESLRAVGELRDFLAQPAAQRQGEAFTYSSKQETSCAGCGIRKHTPLRVDDMGGYVCLTCIDEKLGELLSAQHQGEPVAWRYQSHAGGLWYLSSSEHNAHTFKDNGEGGEVQALYTHADPGDLLYAAQMLAISKNECDRLRAGLVDAIQSLKTISELAGRDEFMRDMTDVRGYAKSRAIAADYILSASAEPAPTSDGFSAGDMADQGAKAFAARDDEVERLQRRIQNADLALKAQAVNCDTLRARLADRDALLRRITGNDHQDSLRANGEAAALSASAAPEAKS
jgi:hypothetical protein